MGRAEPRRFPHGSVPRSPGMTVDPSRPMPPDSIFRGFRLADDVRAWIFATFIDEGSPLENPDHAHLASADLGVLWAFEPARRQMREIVGTAEIPQPRGQPWVKARQEHQLREWFGNVPDLLLTFSADFARDVDDATWCALVEHELYHCAQAVGEWGPRFHQDGTPMYAIRGHDVEEFVGVVRRYGAEAAGPDLVAMVEAASQAPEVAASEIAAACGTCRLRVA